MGLLLKFQWGTSSSNAFFAIIHSIQLTTLKWVLLPSEFHSAHTNLTKWLIYTHVGKSLPYFEAYSYTRRMKYWSAEGIGQFKFALGVEARPSSQKEQTLIQKDEKKTKEDMIPVTLKIETDSETSQ